MLSLKIRSAQIFSYIVDFTLFFISLYLALCLRRLELVSFDTFKVHYESLYMLGVVFLLCNYVAGLYDLNRLRSGTKLITLLFYSLSTTFIIGIFIFYFYISPINPKLIMLLQAVILYILGSAFHLFSYNILIQDKARALLLGSGREFEELKDTINHSPNFPIYFVDHLDLENDNTLFNSSGHNSNISGIISQLEKVLRENNIKIVVSDARSTKVIPLLPYLYNLSSDGILLYDMKRMYEEVFRRMPLASVGYFWYFENMGFNTKLYEFIKRFIDLLISVPLAVIWFILHPFVSFLIKREDGGEIFIKQKRLGIHGKYIYLYKYRTMNFADSGKWVKDEDNPNKVTRIGYYLRKTRIDELPQLLAILKGDISLIGPRPDIIDLGEKMTNEIPFYLIRYAVKPGLSGWAQTMQDTPPQTIEETRLRLQYDLYYIKNRSLILDLIIILKTIRTLLSRTGM